MSTDAPRIDDDLSVRLPSAAGWVPTVEEEHPGDADEHRVVLDAVLADPVTTPSAA